MYYVYSSIKNGRTNLIRNFDTREDAIKHIAKCYKIDRELGCLGEYYYYIR